MSPFQCPSSLLIIGIVFMAHLQASLALKAAASTDSSITIAGVGAYMRVAGVAKATEINSPGQQHRLIRQESGRKNAMGVHAAGSFNLMQPTLAELTAGSSATAPLGAAATDAVAAAELQKAVVAQDEVSLGAAPPASVIKTQTADASTTLLQQTGDTHLATLAATAIAAAPPVVTAEVAYSAPARSTAAVAAPAADATPDSGMPAAAPAASQPLPGASSLDTRVRSMLQLIDHSGSLEKHIPLMILGVVLLLITAMALGGLWHAKRTVPVLSDWRQEHLFLVQYFEEKTQEATTQQATTEQVFPTAYRSSISEPETEEPETEVARQPSYVESLKTMFRQSRLSRQAAAVDKFIVKS